MIQCVPIVLSIWNVEFRIFEYLKVFSFSSKGIGNPPYRSTYWLPPRTTDTREFGGHEWTWNGLLFLSFLCPHRNLFGSYLTPPHPPVPAGPPGCPRLVFLTSCYWMWVSRLTFFGRKMTTILIFVNFHNVYAFHSFRLKKRQTCAYFFDILECFVLLGTMRIQFFFCNFWITIRFWKVRL